MGNLTEIAAEITKLNEDPKGDDQLFALYENNFNTNENCLAKYLVHYHQEYLPHFATNASAAQIVTKSANILCNMSFIITEEMYNKHFAGFLELICQLINEMADILREMKQSDTYYSSLVGTLVLSMTTLSNIICIDKNSNSVRMIICD